MGVSMQGKHHKGNASNEEGSAPSKWNRLALSLLRIHWLEMLRHSAWLVLEIGIR